MRAPGFWWRPSSLLSDALMPLGDLYAAAGWMRFRTVRPQKAPVPVICVGNLVAGGAGKTPLALALLARLSAAGAVPAALLRGYGGRLAGPVRVDPATHDAGAVGDEAMLLARAAPTWVARDRVAGARAAADAGADVVVMDDGFQNPHLAKDFSILAVDGAVGFGTARPMPAGPLREPLGRGLRRAHAVVVVGTDRTEAALLVAHKAPGLPILSARLVPQGVEDLAGTRVLAFAGIGRPEKVFETVREAGAELVEAHAFPDHHPYAPREAAWLVKRARELRAQPVTTEKDWVRLPASMRGEIRALAVVLAFESRDETALDRLLAKTLAATAAAPHA